jgi:asparagine synthase (glutamine-hydrolysing)
LSLQSLVRPILQNIGAIGDVDFLQKIEKIATLLPANDWRSIQKNMTSIEYNGVFKNKNTTTSRQIFADNQQITANLPRSLDHLLAYDYQKCLPDDLLVTVDRATMSVGLEGREPLLDHRILEFVARLPEKIKMPNKRTQKYLLKEIAHRHLPKVLLDRPKIGFEVPLATWLQNDFGDFRKHYLSENLIKKQGVLQPNTMDFIKKYENQPKNAVNTSLIWRILMFNSWWEHWMK